MTADDSHPTLPAADYWRESARPLVSLAFVAPLLVLYEAGVLLLGPAAARNGADVWLRSLLDLAGFGQYFLLPVLTCGLLLAWHHSRREPWRCQWRAVGWMGLESAAYGIGLLLLAQILVQALGANAHEAGPAAVINEVATPIAGRMVGYLGAGIYEELLFRLLLLSAAMAAFRTTRLNRSASLSLAIVLTSLLFAAAHYQLDVTCFNTRLALPHGETFTASSFLFRYAAGCAFGLIYARRGFGVAVGAHALYDLLVLAL